MSSRYALGDTGYANFPFPFSDVPSPKAPFDKPRPVTVTRVTRDPGRRQICHTLSYH